MSYLLLALLLVPVHPVRPQDASPGAASRSGEPGDPALAEVPELEGLVERWSGALADLGAPGCAVAVVRDGAVLGYASLGVRNPAGEPVGPDTMFYIASITKTYTAAAAAKLAEQGELELDGVVEEYLPRFTLAHEQAAWGMTVRELLCHRPGLSSFPIVFLDAYTGQITEDRFYHWLAQVEPTGEVTYSNLHFTLAGRVVEAVAGEPWQEALERLLFEPAGMSRTTARASRMYADPDAALPMELGPEGFVACATRKVDATMHAAGGMGTTARDAARWLLLFLNGGELDGTRVLAAATVEEALRRQSDVEPEGQIRRLDGFGLGWMLGTYRGRPYVTHGGGYVGTAAHMSFLPEQGLGVVVLSNASPAGQALCDVVSIDVYDRLLGLDEGDLLPSYVRSAAERRAAEAGAPAAESTRGALGPDELPLALEACAGRYEHAFWGALELRVEDGLLRGAMGAMPVQLTAGESAERFVLDSAGASEVQGRFVIEDGRAVAVELAGDGLDARLERAGP